MPTITENICKEAYSRSIDLIASLVAGPEYEHLGFFASSTEKDNYKRLFTRDVFWIIMASILSEDEGLLKACRDSIRKLSRYQREDGAIPSNVSLGGKASYGIINPRIDPTTLFIIGCIRFAKRHPGKGIIDDHFGSIRKAVRYLETHCEDKKHGLLYIPRAGNWADEYLQQGFVLYDEVLWYMAIREYADLLRSRGDKDAEKYFHKAAGIKDMINARFWVKNIRQKNKEQIYEGLKKKFAFKHEGYYIHFYHSPGPDKTSFDHPRGIFDAFGNILAVLAGIPSPEQINEIVNFIEEISVNKYPLVPAHYPFFPEEMFRSSRLYQYRFKEFIGHYHNGGLWAWYTGPYVAGLIKNGKREKAEKFLQGVLKANKEKKNGMDFYEYHTGKRAIAYLEVKYPKGIDFELSTLITGIARGSRSMILFHYNRKKVDAENDIALRGLSVQRGGMVKVSAVGPDAQEALKKMSELSHNNSQGFFHCHDIIIKGSKPGGVPLLGVSAAAYVIAYKAFFEGKVIFEECC